MFLKKFFQRDPRHFKEKGQKLFDSGRYADARIAFEQALELLEQDAAPSPSLRSELTGMLAEARNRLADLNIQEAEHAVASGEHSKAVEHLHLAIELAEDVTIREKAEKILKKSETPEPAPQITAPVKSCSTCGPVTPEFRENPHSHEGYLSPAEKFELAIQSLPGDLPGRYARLGKEFATGYVKSYDGDNVGAASIFSQLRQEEENDILLYELAVIRYREGDTAGTEDLLRRAIDLNASNPLPYLSLVQLYHEGGRQEEALRLLLFMREHAILPEQAGLMLGDLYAALGDPENALAALAPLLASPLRKEAAERMIPLLEELGRSREAADLFKRFLKKGCC